MFDTPLSRVYKLGCAITDEIEELELERLQGADGLKALRVTVAV